MRNSFLTKEEALNRIERIWNEIKPEYKIFLGFYKIYKEQYIRANLPIVLKYPKWLVEKLRNEGKLKPLMGGEKCP